MADRYPLLGVAPARAVWFRDLAGWAVSGVLPVELAKCISLDEARSRLSSGRPFSALVVDADTAGLDRDLLALAAESGCATFVVDGATRRDWAALGATSVLDPAFGPAELVDALVAHARPVSAEVTTDHAPLPEAGPWNGLLVAVTGAGGVGTSTVAAALAQSLAAQPRHGGLVALADLARIADQAVLHDAIDVVPGVQELVDAHRVGTPTIEQTRGHVFPIETRGYDLLLGLRRPRDWVALRPRALAAAVAGLRRAYRLVVADVDADAEGEAESGSIDVEERNAASRLALHQADVVVLVGRPDLLGLRHLVGSLHELVQRDVPAERIVTVINHAPRSRRRRAELVTSLAGLLAGDRLSALASPVFVRDEDGLDLVHRDVRRFPTGWVRPVVGAVNAVLARPVEPVADGPELVAPGSLGLAEAP